MTYHVKDTHKNVKKKKKSLEYSESQTKAVIYGKAKSSLPPTVYATPMFPGFNKCRQEKSKTFRLVQSDQRDWAFPLETLSAPRYGENNDSGG